jgi:hypothetical protein
MFSKRNSLLFAAFLLVGLLQSDQPELKSVSAVLGDDVENSVTEAREKQFSEQMAGTILKGSFTVDGKSDGEKLKEESYEIESVVKAAENLWVFTARVRYGTVDTKLPMTVPVEWAGDTPMVTLTNASLPGLGEAFSARVLFYENRYAGTWQHGDVGGHLFGRIEKQQTRTEK